MFQTNQGPSFPAHQFIFGGTSAPTAADDKAGIFASENMSKSGVAGTSAVAGCIADSTTVVQLIGPNGAEDPKDKIYPCFEHNTIPDILPASVTWKYCTPSAGSIWTAPNAINHICDLTGPGGECVGPDWTQKKIDLSPPNVMTDIKNCALPALSWIIPKGQYSDHAKGNAGEGPSWVGDIVDLIGQASTCENNKGYWQDTAILITWDDWGGWYDHEPPTFLQFPEGGYQLGFRVPLIFVSAYTPKGYINNFHHDFGTILRFIEGNFNVPQGKLDFADQRATNDLGLFYDFTRIPRPFQFIKTALPPSYFLNDTRRPGDPDDQ